MSNDQNSPYTKDMQDQIASVMLQTGNSEQQAEALQYFGIEKQGTDNFETANAPEPGQPWVFDENVADSFAHMLENSIPGYSDMREVIYRIGKPTESEGQYNLIVDLGASTGESIQPFIEKNSAKHYLLLDSSKPMVQKLIQRFPDDNVSSRYVDLRCRNTTIVGLLTWMWAGTEGYRRADLVLSILTMIFIPINFRPNIIRGIYESLKPGGKFILTEKLQGSDWLVDNLLVDTYHEYKHDKGYSWEAIERKRLSLEGVQVPLSERANIDMLQRAGFQHVECVHRHLNFATFVAIK